MKSNVVRKEVQTSNIGEKSGFTIKASPKAFRILSSGLYADKVKAIIRELSTNAYDAQVSVGKGHEPFKVNLPNSFEPRFEVRDYGSGLSEEDVLHLYTTYFESTKTESNDYVGALGLGSKSPFSYTDSFTVISYFNGKKTTYMAFIDNDFPNISKAIEENTTEPNGLEIQVPVRPKDFSEFISKATQVYKSFEVKPIIRGAKISLENNKEVFFENSYAKIYINSKNGYYYNNTYNVYARMGNILYPLNYDNFLINPVGITDNEFKNLKNMLQNVFDFEMKFDIGEIDIAASREELSYDESTIEAIQKKLCKLYLDLREEYKDFYKDCKTYYEAATKLSIETSKNSRLTKWLVGTITYNGEVPYTEERFELKDINASICSDPFKYRRKITKSIYSSQEPIFTFYYNTFYKIVINDVNVGVLKRIENEFRSQKIVTAIVIEEKTSDPIALKAFLDKINNRGIPVYRTSTMTYDKDKPKKIDKDDRLIYYFEKHRNIENQYYATSHCTKARDLDKGFVYVNGEANSIKDSGLELKPSVFGDYVIKDVKKIFPDLKVYVVYKTQQDVIKKYNGIHLKDYIKNNLKKSKKYNEFVKTLKINTYQTVIKKYNKINYGNYSNFVKLKTERTSHNLFKYINFVNKIYAPENKKVNINLAKYAKIYFDDSDLQKNPSCDKLEKYVANLHKKYPMVFDMIDLDCDISSMKPYIEKYILDIDKMKG